MDVNALRDFVNDHPDGFEIVMVNGTSYKLPHRDYIWFTPRAPSKSGPPKRLATSLYVNTDGTTRLVNAMLVAHVREWTPSRGGKRRKSA